MYLDGRGIRHRDPRGRPVQDDSYLVQLHAGAEPVTVHLPGDPWADGYEFVVSTEWATGGPPPRSAVAPRPRRGRAQRLRDLTARRRPSARRRGDGFSPAPPT